MSNDERKEILLKEVDLIQNCITRMGQNSFEVKGWVISLLAACCAITTLKMGEWTILLIVCMAAIVIFWYLDAFFLKTEKLYRYKYEWVIKKRMDTDDYMLDLNPYNENMWLPDKDEHGNDVAKEEPTIKEIMLSITLRRMYIPLMLIDLIAIIVQVIQLFK